MRVTFADGGVLTGSYTSRVGLHFLHRTGPTLPLIGEVSGPYQPGDVLAVDVVRTRAQVLADAYARLHGEGVPGREPQHARRPRGAPAGPRQRRGRRGRRRAPAAPAPPPVRRGGRPHRPHGGQARVAAQRRSVGQALQPAARHGRPLDRPRGVAVLPRAPAAAGLRPRPARPAAAHRLARPRARRSLVHSEHAARAARGIIEGACYPTGRSALGLRPHSGRHADQGAQPLRGNRRAGSVWTHGLASRLGRQRHRGRAQAPSARHAVRCLCTDDGGAAPRPVPACRATCSAADNDRMPFAPVAATPGARTRGRPARAASPTPQSSITRRPP